MTNDRSDVAPAPRRLERWEFFMERIGRSHNQTFVFEKVDPDDVSAVQQVVEAMTRHISRHLGSAPSSARRCGRELS